MIKINDTVLTKQNSLCKVQSIRTKFALLKGVGSSKNCIAKLSDLRTLKAFHGINVIV